MGVVCVSSVYEFQLLYEFVVFFLFDLCLENWVFFNSFVEWLHSIVCAIF